MNDLDSTQYNWQRLRLPLVIIALILLYLWARQSGILEDADPYRLRALVELWGIWGVSLYLALFCIGLFLYVPGLLFVVAAGLAYGRIGGIPIALLGANLAVTVSFLAVRFVGGTPFERHSHPLLQKILGSLHASPITNIAILRLLFSTSPALNYLLALSAVTPRQHFLGTLIGTLAPVTITVYLTDRLVSLFF